MTATLMPDRIASVVWILPKLDPHVIQTMRAVAGERFEVQPCLPGTSVESAADLRILPLGFLPTNEARLAEYRRDPRPTVILFSDPETERLAYGIASPLDEIGADGEVEHLRIRLPSQLERLLARREQFRLAELVHRDQLTGLLNRRGLERAAPTFLRELPSNRTAGLLLIDIDDFKRVNDTLGHVAGDEALVQICARLLSSLELSDHLTRYGGEEFAVLAQRPTRDELVSLAERLRIAVASAPFKLVPADSSAGSASVPLTVSVGASMFMRGMTLNDAAAQADQALYDAKATGRNRVVSHDDLQSAADAEDGDLRLLHFQNVARVVTERTNNLVTLFGRSLVESANRAANRDRLTEIWNRSYFDRRIQRELDLARKDGRQLSLAMFDLDHFGQFNKDHGLPMADTILRRFAQIAVANIRPVDWFARYGGEEVALVVPGDAEEAKLVARRIRDALNTVAVETPTGCSVGVTASVGVASFVPAMERPEDLIQRASDALQLAKREGRDRIVVAGAA
jgi:two-component system cell cycle response regulator